MPFSDTLADWGETIAGIIGIDIDPGAPVPGETDLTVVSVLREADAITSGTLSSAGKALSFVAQAPVKILEGVVDFAKSLSLNNVLLIVSLVLTAVVGLFIVLG